MGRVSKEVYNRYKKKRYYNVLLQLNRITDADIISCLCSKENKSGFLKDLIREDIKKSSL